MKKIILILSTVVMFFFTTGCDNKFEELNTNPNLPVEVPAHLLLGNVIRVNQNIIYGMQQGGDMGMCWAQHASKIVYNDEERYIPRLPSIDGIWNALYTTVLFDAQSMEEFAIKEGNTNIQAISLVIQANAFQILTDLYGPIMFSEFNTGNIKPVYDSQEIVYNGINEMLIQADALLANGIGEVPATSDLIYSGDVAKWRKFANSLRLKVLMRMSSKVDVSSQVAGIVSAGNLMESNADSAQLIYLGSQPDANPIYETVVFGTRFEYKVSSVLVDKLNALTDPRLAVFAAPVAGGSYVGNVPGTENQAAINDVSGFGSFYLSPTLPGVMLSYAQVQFLLAEAANEGYIGGGITQALAYYNNGITANMAFNGLTVTTGYLNQASVIFSTYNDAKQKIAEQSWIALFGQGFEAWTEWRRTKFPVLSPVQNAALPSIPGRLFYNSLEVSLNNTNYVAASATLNNGDKLTSKVWWMN